MDWVLDGDGVGVGHQWGMERSKVDRLRSYRCGRMRGRGGREGGNYMGLISAHLYNFRFPWNLRSIYNYVSYW